MYPGTLLDWRCGRRTLSIGKRRMNDTECVHCSVVIRCRNQLHDGGRLLAPIPRHLLEDAKIVRVGSRSFTGQTGAMRPQGVSRNTLLRNLARRRAGRQRMPPQLPNYRYSHNSNIQNCPGGKNPGLLLVLELRELLLNGYYWGMLRERGK